LSKRNKALNAFRKGIAMKDNEARGLVLKRLYELRHEVPQASLEHFEGLPFGNAVLFNVLDQLAQENMIDWLPHRVGGAINFFANAHIKVLGVKVMEGTATLFLMPETRENSIWAEPAAVKA